MLALTKNSMKETPGSSLEVFCQLMCTLSSLKNSQKNDSSIMVFLHMSLKVPIGRETPLRTCTNIKKTCPEKFQFCLENLRVLKFSTILYIYNTDTAPFGPQTGNRADLRRSSLLMVQGFSCKSLNPSFKGNKPDEKLRTVAKV